MLLSPLRYPGSKAKVLDKIIPYVEEANKFCGEYREPFVGGGSIFLNSIPFEINWLNDSDPNIATFFKVMRDHPDELCARVKDFNRRPTLEYWTEVKFSNPTDEIEIAFRTLFLNRANYSGILGSGPIGGFRQRSDYSIDCRWSPDVLVNRILSFSARLQGVKITNLDFYFVLTKVSRSRVFFLLDPPYYEKGNDLYDHKMSHSDHERLRDLLRETRHLFLLTYDNCEQVRKLYKDVNGLYFYETGWKYTTATASGERQTGKEIFISNFPVEGMTLSTLSEEAI